MTITYDIELVPAILTPFDWSTQGNASVNTTASAISANPANGYATSAANQQVSTNEQAQVDFLATSSGLPIGYFSNTSVSTSPTGLSTAGGSIYPTTHPLYPLTLTGGLVFPYNPTISESLGTKYDVTELIHSNENVHTFKNNDNVRITLSDCVWTAETFDQAIYTLGVIHFFRSYRLMDFGQGATGRPPSPMWFSAYGSYLYNAVPVLIERVDFSLPPDIDYVGVPNPGTASYNSQTLTYSTSSQPFAVQNLLGQTGDFTWIPIKFTVNSISMVVQNSVNYWTHEFNLAQFKAGQLIGVR